MSETTIKKFERQSRDEISFTSDLFKASLGKMKKNLSWDKDAPILDDVEHRHFFRTYNSQGKEQTRTTPVGGHWHDVEFKENKDGSITVKCGPPLKYITVKNHKGVGIRKISTIEFIKKNDDGTEKRTKDDHTHEFTYMGSEILSPQKIRKGIEQDQSRLKAMGGTSKPAQKAAPKTTPKVDGVSES